MTELRDLEEFVFIVSLDGWSATQNIFLFSPVVENFKHYVFVFVSLIISINVNARSFILTILY